MKFPVKFVFAIIMALGWIYLKNEPACASWTAAALVISCFRKDG